MSLEIRDPRLSAVVGRTVEVERIAGGFIFTEGPLWHPREKFLLFSDMPGDIVRRWSPTEGVKTFRQPCNKANGETYDRQGRLVTCEHATSRVTRTEPDGTITVLATHHGDKELNSPNDIVVKSDGAIYFTDPTYGRAEFYGMPREPELDFRGVYRLEPETRKLTLLAADFAQPNGLCFSPDEKRLFVNDTERRHIRIFDVQADGLLTNGRVWAETTGTEEGWPDGMKTDGAGNLYCSGPGGIHVFDPGGTCLGVIRTPEPTANFTFGEDDCRSLFITASTSVYRLRVAIPGRPVF
jgi:gluconolactonase